MRLLHRKVARELTKIPDDMAVIGYVSERMAPYLAPELTTINQHSYTMENSSNAAVGNFKNKSNKDHSVVINSTLKQILPKIN